MGEAPEPEGRPVRVLVVDDDPEYVRFLRNAFEERGGYEVETAGGGFQAVYVIGERRPDVLLLDIRMPDLDGFDVLQALEDSHDLKAIHVIAFTGLEGDSVRQRMGAYSVDAFFRKPIDMEALFAEIETTFGDAAATG
jgi:CheY-like chemotaxis protein